MVVPCEPVVVVVWVVVVVVCVVVVVVCEPVEVPVFAPPAAPPGLAAGLGAAALGAGAAGFLLSAAALAMQVIPSRPAKIIAAGPLVMDLRKL
jgi:hypothetical protein